MDFGDTGASVLPQVADDSQEQESLQAFPKSGPRAPGDSALVQPSAGYQIPVASRFAFVT